MFLGVFCLMLFAMIHFFDSKSTSIDSKYENIFLSHISKSTCKENLFFYTNTSHMGGTQNQFNLTQHMLNQFNEYFKEISKDEVSISTEQYDVLLSYPNVESNVELFEENNKIHEFTMIEDEKFPQEEFRGIFFLLN
jgi:hypothetical protein